MRVLALHAAWSRPARAAALRNPGTTTPRAVLVCPKCAGPRRVLVAIHDRAAIARVLAALGLTAAAADPAGCRAPPAAEGDAADEGDAAE